VVPICPLSMGDTSLIVYQCWDSQLLRILHVAINDVFDRIDSQYQSYVTLEKRLKRGMQSEFVTARRTCYRPRFSLNMDQYIPRNETSTSPLYLNRALSKRQLTFEFVTDPSQMFRYRLP
jgi:hypothetical protein